MRFLSLLALLARAKRAAEPRPNVVSVMTDDQGLRDISFTGNPVLQTPKKGPAPSSSCVSPRPQKTVV